MSDGTGRDGEGPEDDRPGGERDGDGLDGGDGAERDGGADGSGREGDESGADERTVPVGVVDAFASEPLAGAPVGVVPEAGGIGGETRRALARELGGSGTAFVGPADDADARLWYVAAGADRGRPGPAAGGDGAGDDGADDENRRDGDGDGSGDDGAGDDAPGALPIRAPVAAVARLLADGRVAPGSHALATAAGVVEVEATDEGVVWVAAGEPSVEAVDPDYDRLGAALGVAPAALRDVGADLPAAVASVGRPFLVVPINFLERLSGADPDGEALAALADEYGVAGVYLVTFDALGAGATLHARSFPAAPGAPEEPVTGSAAGAAGAYLHAVEAFDGDPPDELRVEQGHLVDRPGVVRVRVTDEGVRVGGRGTAAVEGRARLPDEAPDDDILVA